MSVIVTDMKMPDQCFSCEFSKRLDNSSVFCERKPTEAPIIDGTERPTWCPLKKLEGDNK